MPILAEFSTAAKIRVGKNSTVLGPNKRERPVVWRFTDVEPAVAGQQNGIRTFHLQTLVVEQKHGHERFVLGLVPNLLNLEGGGIKWHLAFGPHFGFRSLHVVPEYGWCVVIGLEGNKELRAFPTPRGSSDRAKRRRSDRTFRFAIAIEDLQLGGGVTRVLSNQLSAGGGDGFQVHVAGGNNLTPVFALRGREGCRKDVPLGSFPIRQDEKTIPRKGRVKDSLLVIDRGHHRAVLFHVLNIDLRFFRSGTVDDQIDEIGAVLRQLQRKNLLSP